MAKIKQICPQCKKEFEVEAWRNQRFCSIQCGVDFHKGTTFQTLECAYCGKKFEIEPWKHRKYCSNECNIASKKGITYENRKCLYCGKIFQIQPFKTNKYCSQKCMGMSYRNPEKRKRNMALQDVNGRYIHRLVIEKYLGRKLLPTERVHHIDFNKLNNNLDNLYLFNNESSHQKAHRSLDKIVLSLMEKKIIKFYKGKYVLN